MNTNITITRPVKKENNYVARVTTVGKPMRLRVYATYMSTAILDKGGKTMRIYIPDADVTAVISDVDDLVRAETIAKNSEWFNNDMDQSTIDRLFKDSLNKMHSTMTVLLSDTREANWYVDNECADSDIQLKAGQDVGLDLEIQGLFFYPKKFGIRWIVRNVYVGGGAGPEACGGGAEDLTLGDKALIEASWDADVDDVHASIDKDIGVYEAHIRQLQNLKGWLVAELEAARSVHAMNATWESKLRGVAKKCASYFAGEVA